MYREVFVSYLQNFQGVWGDVSSCARLDSKHIELPTEGNDVPTNVFRPVWFADDFIAEVRVLPKGK